MKKSENLLRNRKGISSLFIAVYVSMIAVIVISTLFYDLSITNSSLNSYSRDSQERMQEKILVKALNASGNEIEFILVNNTGAITVRIRSIYIDGKYTCDPSEFSGDSYIQPQRSKWFVLSQLHIQLNASTILGNWTITTERGTKSSDTGKNLISNSNYNEDSNKLYFGPLLLLFNEFKWTNNNGVTWNDGWTIPQNPGNLIWRIRVTDIDERPIILKSSSSFAMVQNSHQSNKIARWLIGPANLNPQNLIMYPQVPYDLHFSLNGPNSLDYMYTPIPISSNFLTILGSFIEQDGSYRDFGQTIPFEAVKVSDLPQIDTAIVLNAISSPQTVGQSVAVSGQVSVVNSSNPAVPSGSSVVVQYSQVGLEEWVNIRNPQITTTSSGQFAGAFAPPHAGMYEFRATFIGATQGQREWSPSSSTSQIITVNKAISTTTLQAMSPITIGQSTTVAADVNPSFATGTVTFEVSTDGGSVYNLFCTKSVLAGSAVSDSYTPPAPGNSYRFRATYNGDSDVLSSPTSAPVTLTVNKATPTLSIPTLTPPSPINIGDSVTATVTITGVAGIPPSGAITFRVSADGGTTWNTISTANLVSNSATSDPYTPQSGGNLYRFRADYSGDSNYNNVNSGLTPLTVRTYPSISTPTLTPSNSVPFGTPVTATVAVSGSYGTPTGSVDFQVSTDGGGTFNKLGTTKTLSSGIATSDPYLAPSTGSNYQFRAVYAGDNNYLGIQSSPVSLTVIQAQSTTTVTLSPQSAPLNQPVTATATVTPLAATGTVQFEVSTDGGITFSQLGNPKPLGPGFATSDPYTPTTPGSNYRFRATYSGDFNVLGSTSPPTSLTVFGPLDHFTFGTISSPRTAGIGFSITVTAQDAYGNTVSNYGGSNSLSASIGTVSPANTGTFVNGVRTLTITLTTAGSDITVTTTGGGASGLSNSFTVNSGALASFQFAPIGSPQTAGTPFSVTITAQDAYGNTVISYTGTNTLTVPAGAITPTTTTSFTNGAWTGAVNLTRASASATITTNGGVPTRSGISNSFTVVAAEVDHFNFSTINNQIADVPFTMTITAIDAYGNVATSYNGINSLSDLSDSISPTYTGSFSNGVWTSAVTIISRYPTDTISTSGNGKSGTSNAFNVTGPLDHFNFNPIGDQTAGTPFTITMTAVDSAGSTITGYAGTNTLTVSTGTINPTSTGSFTNGVRTVSVTLNTAGSDITISTSEAPPTRYGTSNPFSVAPAAIDHFTMTGYPNSITAGQAFSGITVTAFDFYNNVKTNYVGQVYFTSTDSLATLPFTASSKYIFSSGDRGTRIFDGFVLKTAGSRTITVRDDAASKTLTSNPIIVNPAPVDHFSFGAITSPKTVNSGFIINITAQDIYGNTATGYNGLTTLTASTGAGTINPASVTFSNGQWSGSVTLNRAGIGATISATNGGITGASNAFNVYGSLIFSSTISPISFRPGINQQYSVTITNLDSGNNLGSARIVIPNGFSVSSATITPPGGRSWSNPVVGSGLISVTSNSGNNNPISVGESIVITFTPIQTPITGALYTWTTTAYSDRNYGGTQFSPPNPQPQVTIQYYLTITSTSGSATGQGWYTAGSTAYASLTSGTVNGGTGTQYVFSNWSGDASGTNYPQSSSITMSANRTVVANWQTQYYLTVTSGRGSPSPVSGWFLAGSTITASVSSPADSSGDIRYRCTGFSGTGNVPASGTFSSATFTINSPSSITWSWIAQYKLTLNTAPVAVGTNQITASPISSDGFYDAGISVSLTSTTPVLIDSTSQYRFNYWSGDATGSTNPAMVTMDSAKSVIANYQTQYSMTLAQTGLDSDAVGTIVTVGGATKGFSDLPYIAWVDAGNSITFSYSTPVGTTTADKQYALTISNATSPLTVNGPQTITGDYTTQFRVSFTQSGLDSNAAGTVVTINSVAKTYSDLPVTEIWVDRGTTYTYTNAITSSASTQYVLLTPTGPASPIVTSGTVGGVYKTQFLVTFNQNGLDATASGTVLTVDGSPKTLSMLPFTTAWLDSGTSLTFNYANTIGSSTQGKQFALSNNVNSQSPLMVTAPITLTGEFNTRYQLTITSPYGTVGGPDWFNAGTTVYATLNTGTVALDVGTQYAFTTWSGDASGTNYVQSNPITMDNEKTATANWKAQYLISFTVSPSGSGTTTPNIDTWYDNGTSGLQISASANPGYTFSSWSPSPTVAIADSSSNLTTATISGPGTITANFL